MDEAPGRSPMPAVAIEAETALDVEQAFDAHHAMVFRTAYRVTGNAGDAEDVLQTVFLRLVRRPAEAATVGKRGELPAPGGGERRAGRGARAAGRAGHSARGCASRGGLLSWARPRAGLRRNAGWLRATVARLSPRAAEIFALRFYRGPRKPRNRPHAGHHRGHRGGNAVAGARPRREGIPRLCWRRNMSPEDNELDQILSDIRNEAVDPAVGGSSRRPRPGAPGPHHAALLRRFPGAHAGLPGGPPHGSAARCCSRTTPTSAWPAARRWKGRARWWFSPRRAASTARAWFRWAMAAGGGCVAVLAGWSFVCRLFLGRRPYGVEAANGPVYRVSARQRRSTGAGAELRRHRGDPHRRGMPARWCG